MHIILEWLFLQGEVEYYREQYRKLKSEHESLIDRVDELAEEMESAKVCNSVLYIVYVCEEVKDDMAHLLD